MTKLGVHFPVINHNTDFCEKGVEYRICMERVAKERCDSKRSDYVLASIEGYIGCPYQKMS